MNPFDLKGPDFLTLYVIVLAVALLSAYLLRQAFRKPADMPPSEAMQLQPYEVAYLAGGTPQAVNAALANLVHRGLLLANAAERTLSAPKEPSAKLLPFERSVYDSVQEHKNLSVRELHSSMKTAGEALGDRPRALGLLVAEDRAVLGRVVPTLLIFAVAGFGLIKVLVGMARHKPVGILVLLCIGTAAVALAGFARRLHRTWRGDVALERWKIKNSALEYAVPRNAHNLTASDLALAVGLFGAGVLSSGPLSDLKTALAPPAGSSACGTGGSCGSGCGGGCGGGGCGGCGG
jgi:uncharacterized protein (TIGR04222 family)